MDEFREIFIGSYFLYTAQGWQVVSVYKRIAI